LGVRAGDQSIISPRDFYPNRKNAKDADEGNQPDQQQPEAQVEMVHRVYHPNLSI
jgi:hypothetical protein